MRWALRILVMLSVAAVVLGGVLLASRRSRETLSGPIAIHAAERPAREILGTVPEWTLTEKSGRPLGRSDLRGKVWIADFIFTRCAGPCPKMTGVFARLDRAVEAPGLRLVTFTMDPDHDTPEVLAQYARDAGASPRWLFVTGPLADITALSVQGFKLGAGTEGNQIIHSTRFVLVDRESRIRGYYDGEDEGAISRLEGDARALLAESTERAGGRGEK